MTIKSTKNSFAGGEYMSQEFLDHLKEHGILCPSHSSLHASKQRSVKEEKSNTARHGSIYDGSNTYQSLLGLALRTACPRILNMVPTKKVDKTPYEIWHGQAPKLSYLKVWGCEALVKRDTLTKPDKLDPRSFRYLKASESVEDLELIQEEDTNPSVDTSLNHEEDDQEIDEPQSDINPIRRSTRTRRPTDQLCLYIDAEEPRVRDLGYVFVLNGGAVDWKSTKQSISATTSSTNAEYIAAFDASKEAVWIRKFISGLNVVPTIEELEP
ncbi:retrotransposon protein, putative, ty1-copia subclass [Tanacetum coccineum]